MKSGMLAKVIDLLVDFANRFFAFRYPKSALVGRHTIICLLFETQTFLIYSSEQGTCGQHQPFILMQSI